MLQSGTTETLNSTVESRELKKKKTAFLLL